MLSVNYSKTPTMTLRRRSRAVENLRLANLQNYIITEDEPDLSPCTTRPPNTRFVPRRINEDTYEEIMASFHKFRWERPKIDGIVLCDYRRFVNAMVVPTKEAIEPWVDWVELHLGWERHWILENPVATKKEVVRRFEGDREEDAYVVTGAAADREKGGWPQDIETRKSLDEVRRGAVSRMGFRDDEESEMRSKSALGFRITEREISPRAKTRLGFRRDEEAIQQSSFPFGWRFMKKKVPSRPTSALGFSEVKMLGRQFSTLKKKALTNPWQKRTNNAQI